MPHHPLSVQLYTIREAYATDPAAALERLAGLGFGSVELFGFVERAAEFAELLPRFGLVPSSAHTTLIDQDPVPILDAARLLGITTVIDPYIPAETWADPDALAAAAEQLSAFALAAADFGITVGYHNHWWELEGAVGDSSPLESFAARLDPAVILEVDTYWAQVGGAPAVPLLGRLGDRVRFIHVKDGDISLDNMKQVAVGDGRMPVLDVLAAAPNAVRVVELDEFDGDVFEALARSVAFLTAHGETL